MQEVSGAAQLDLELYHDRGWFPSPLWGSEYVVKMSLESVIFARALAPPRWGLGGRQHFIRTVQ